MLSTNKSFGQIFVELQDFFGKKFVVDFVAVHYLEQFPFKLFHVGLMCFFFSLYFLKQFFDGLFYVNVWILSVWEMYTFSEASSLSFHLSPELKAMAICRVGVRRINDEIFFNEIIINYSLIEIDVDYQRVDRKNINI